MKSKPKIEFVDGPALYYGDPPPPEHELVADKKAIREEQKNHSRRKTVRVKSELP